MAKLASQSVPGGDAPNGKQRRTQSNNRPSKGGNAKKTSKQVSREQDDAASEAETSEGDSSATAEHEDESQEEPDDVALSDAQNLDALNAEQRLAGLHSGDIMFDDEPQAVAGATATMTDSIGDDDDYGDVEEISDDEESLADESDRKFRRAAEMDLIDEFERGEEQRDSNFVTSGMNGMFLQDDDALARELSVNGGGEAQDEAGPNIDLDEDPFLGLPAGDSLYQEMWDDAEDALALWRTTDETKTRDNSVESGLIKKRVRFMDTRSRSSSMSSSEDPNEVFPDLFAAQDDPMVRQRFALDVDPDATFQYDQGDAGSYYDFDGEEELLALEIDVDSDSEVDVSDIDSEYHFARYLPPR